MRTKKPKAAPVNDALRHWTRGVSFTLAMGKTQVVTLVAIHASQDLPSLIGLFHKGMRCSVTATRGLEDRGLVRFHPLPDDWAAAVAERKRRPTMRYYKEITDAGELVVGLLKLTGIYAEIEAELRASDTSRRADVRLMRSA